MIKLMIRQEFGTLFDLTSLYRPCRASNQGDDPDLRLAPEVIDIMTLTCLFRQILAGFPI